MSLPLPKTPRDYTGDDVHAFMNRHCLNINQFAELLSVTPQAVRLWITNSRGLSATNGKLLRMFDRRPELMQEFK
jgi:DNA-binding transcriptional regulator YiaG